MKPHALGPIVLLAAVAGAPPSRAAPADGAFPISFNRDVRPILSDRCFKCHGFDASARKAELRLDTWDGLTAAHDGRRAVLPGDPDASELIRRVESADATHVMPPLDSDLELSPDERARLRRWIAEGAPFERHWGFVSPQRPAVPDVDGGGAWPRNEIDRFILVELRANDLEPSPAADRETLIRRATLDLTGLPPSPEETDAFVGDSAADAFERLVDRLLQSPAYGERMAMMWLDAARYADTNGFHHDNVRTIWPYRDWVIRAFQENLPYDRFVIEQLAGDLLPDATIDQRVATAFCRMHNINDEGGALDEEYRVEAVADRIETIATTFMGLTFTCARCHDHKYDPITQEDYYSLFAYFDSVDERGVYPNDFEQARAYPARVAYRPGDLDRRTDAARGALEDARDDLAAAEPGIAAELSIWEQTFRDELGVRWVDAELTEAAAASGASAVAQDDDSIRFEGPAPNQDVYTFVLRTGATDLRLLRVDALADSTHPNRSVGRAENGNAVVSAIRAEATSLADPEQTRTVDWAWAWADHEQPNGDFDVMNAARGDGDGWALQGHVRAENRTALLLAEDSFGFDGGTEVRVTVECKSRYARHVIGRPRVSLAATARSPIERFPVVPTDWWQAGPFTGGGFDALYDHEFGPESVFAIDRDHRFGDVPWVHRPDLVDGVPLALEGERAAFYFARVLRTPVPCGLTLSLGSDDAIRVFLNGDEVLGDKALRGVAPDQNQVTISLRPGENVLVLKIVNDGGPAGVYHRAAAPPGSPDPLAPLALIPPQRRDATTERRFVDEFGRRQSPTYARLAGEVERLAAALAALENEAIPVLVMSELPQPTKTHVLTRGRYDAPDEARPVERRPPALIELGLPDGAPNDRLGFARWLVRPDHPLTARVHVNRLWQMIFGAGIVKTSEDFGRQADWPSHPELLDWLAVEFVESGFDQKALLRRILTSATYRQSSRTSPASRTIDPDNRRLSHFPRRRVPAEVIRDQALFVSGLLVDRIGGPSVKPYQPLGLWREVSIGGSSNTQVFEPDDGEALYRRSLYTFWKRTSPNPQMTTFDSPSREYCVVRRGVTNTPLQALVLWNDVQFVEAARALAQRTLAEADGTDARAERLFRRATGRRPNALELERLGAAWNGFLERYATSEEDAARLLAQGESPLPDDYDAAELAAWTMIANAVLSLDETIVRD